MSIKNQLHKIFLFPILALVFLVTACDQNIAPPEALQDTSETISIEFAADDDVVKINTGTTLRWNITDSANTIDSIAIDQGLGGRPFKGSAPVAPQRTTKYTLEVFVNGKVAKARQVVVEVVNDAGELIPEDANISVPVTVETLCDDGADDDNDNAIDCNDSDCVASDVCKAQEFKFSSVVYEPADPTFSEPVTLTWESNFKRVQLVIDYKEYPQVFEGNGSLTINAGDLAQSTKKTDVVLKGFTSDAGIFDIFHEVVGWQEIPVDSFSALIKTFEIDGGNALYFGEPYKVLWNVELAKTVDMDGYTTHTGPSAELSAGDYESHALTVTDQKGLSDVRMITPDVAQFEEKGTLPSALMDYASLTSGRRYMATATKIFEIKNDFTLSEVVITGIAGDIRGIDAFGENLAIATTTGVYLKKGEAGPFVIAVESSRNRAIDFNDVHFMANGDLLMGLTNSFYKASVCGVEGRDVCSPERAAIGYSAAKVVPFAGRRNISEYTASPLNVSRFVTTQNRDNVYVLAGQSVYYTENAVSTSGTDPLITSGMLGGHCDSEACYFWSSSTAKRVTDKTTVRIFDVQGAINLVGIYQTDTQFFADGSGVHAKQDAHPDPFLLNLDVAISALFPIDSVPENADDASRTHLMAVTRTGKIYILKPHVVLPEPEDQDLSTSDSSTSQEQGGQS